MVLLLCHLDLGTVESVNHKREQLGSGVNCVQTKMVLSRGLTMVVGRMLYVHCIFPRFGLGMSPPWNQ